MNSKTYNSALILVFRKENNIVLRIFLCYEIKLKFVWFMIEETEILFLWVYCVMKWLLEKSWSPKKNIKFQTCGR